MTVDVVLAALADPARRRLLDALGEQGAATATALAADETISRQAVVKHLGVLERAGLVTPRRAGREVFYEIRPDRVEAAARWLADRAATWDRRLAAIKRLAENL